MNILKTFLAAGSVALIGSAAGAATVDPDGPYGSTDSCVDGTATNNGSGWDMCFGSATPTPTNSQKLDVADWNTNTFGVETGLFGISEWIEVASEGSFGGGQTGSFEVDAFDGVIALIAKGGNTWEAYKFDGGLTEGTIMYDFSDSLASGLSNWILLGVPGDSTEIPLPAAGWLLLGGLGGLAAMKRRRKS